MLNFFVDTDKLEILILCPLIFGRLSISFDEAMMSGVACNLESRGFHVLCKATEEVVGYVKPYSITGSLPLIRELQVVIPPLFTHSFRCPFSNVADSLFMIFF